MTNPAVQSSLDSLKAIYTIILALAIGEAFKQFVADKAPDPKERNLQWDRLPALLSFLLLIVPFYHGMLRYFFDTYVQHPGPSPYGVWLILDCLAFTIEAILFFVLSRSLPLAQWRRFYTTVVLLLSVDLLWVLIVAFAHGTPTLNWAYLDFIAVFLFGLIFFVYREYKPESNWRALPAILPVLLILVRTLVDYAVNNSFYFPPEQLPASTAEGISRWSGRPDEQAKVRIYFAAPLFSQAQWLWNKRLTQELEALGFSVSLPQNTAEPMLKGAQPFDAGLLFSSNVAGIDRADVVIAILDEADPDSGTSWECGYAYKTGRPIIAVRTDIRRVGDDPAASINLMLSRSCDRYLAVPLSQLDDVRDLALKIASALHEVLNAPCRTFNSLAETRTKPVVYIASPYSKGDRELNTKFQCGIFEKLLTDGKAWPVAPLWAHFQNKLFPHQETDWIAYDKAMIARCDICLRLQAKIPENNYMQSESQGADAEAELFRNHGKPVFSSIEELYKSIDSARQSH